MMSPKLSGIDHIHVYVDSWVDAEAWYARVLGFKRVEKLMVWAVKGGPLTIENPEGTVHLALFERKNHPATSAIAFATDGAQFMTWKDHLEQQGLELRIANHELAYSLYFKDPFDNLHEITTYDHAYVAGQIDQ